MNEIVNNINNRDFEKVYREFIFSKKESITINMLNFLFDCNPSAAYDFVLYCLEKYPYKVFRLMLCHLLTYGEFFVENAHSIIYQQTISILEEDSTFLPALEFVIYNYYEHPESPFSNVELLLFANRLVQETNDKVALKILRDNHVHRNTGTKTFNQGTNIQSGDGFVIDD